MPKAPSASFIFAIFVCGVTSHSPRLLTGVFPQPSAGSPPFYAPGPQYPNMIQNPNGYGGFGGPQPGLPQFLPYQPAVHSQTPNAPNVLPDPRNPSQPGWDLTQIRLIERQSPKLAARLQTNQLFYFNFIYNLIRLGKIKQNSIVEGYPARTLLFYIYYKYITSSRVQFGSANIPMTQKLQNFVTFDPSEAFDVIDKIVQQIGGVPVTRNNFVSKAFSSELSDIIKLQPPRGAAPGATSPKPPQFQNPNSGNGSIN